MAKEGTYCVYILTNKWNTVTYVGVTNALARRVHEHREKLVDGFTKRYNINKLVHVEVFARVDEAIAREKQLKGGSRAQKVALIERENPQWSDLYETIVS
ncbi:MAG: GIY-YIG nuclease family protein [bacterium]|nr:GIY-YIG nuclease family protein [bacterium]